MRLLLIIAALLASSGAASAREAVEASEPEKISVTVYRDPLRREGQRMDRDWPEGFAMISERRRVTLPPGKSTIRFVGVAEGMVAVSAIVTGLPGGTIEKNRNADLLSPAALVDGTLGNRVTISRTDPATGQAQSEPAIVRTRADGGLVLETRDGFEAVRCSGLPEKLVFDRVPPGLTPEPVFTIDTASETGGTFEIVLTYLAWGFDWDAHYVAQLGAGRRGGGVRFDLLSWLTVLNDNGQTFEDSELLAVAGTINVESDFEGLSDPPDARPLRLTCYPLGSTAQGSPMSLPPPPPPPPPAPPAMDGAIVVTGSRVRNEALESAAPVAMIAGEEPLGDLKLFRVPEPVTIAAKSTKQVAFLQRSDVDGDLVYLGYCDAEAPAGSPDAAEILLVSENVEDRGLGQSLPMGGISVFEQSAFGDQLVASTSLRDLAVGRDVELALSESTQVFIQCGRSGPESRPRRWTEMAARVTNANPDPVRIRLDLGWAGDWDVSRLSGVHVKDGRAIAELMIPANTMREVRFRMRSTDN